MLDVLVSTTALTERIATFAPAGAEWLDSLQILSKAPRLANLEQRQLFEQVTLVLRTLAAKQPGLKVLLLSGFPEQLQRGKAELTGRVETLTKPCSVEDLRARIAALIG